jgi:hypothetical protein
MKNIILFLGLVLLVACGKDAAKKPNTITASMLMQIYAGDSTNNWYSDLTKIIYLNDSAYITGGYTYNGDTSIITMLGIVPNPKVNTITIGNAPVISLILNNPKRIYFGDSGTIELSTLDTTSKYLTGKFYVRVVNVTDLNDKLRLKGEFDGTYNK